MEVGFPPINWTVVISAFIGALPLILAQLVNLITSIKNRKVVMDAVNKAAVEIRVIKRATNGMQKVLMKQAEAKGHKAGVADEKAAEAGRKDS